MCESVDKQKEARLNHSMTQPWLYKDNMVPNGEMGSKRTILSRTKFPSKMPPS